MGPLSLPGPSGIRESLGLARRLFREPIPTLDAASARYGSTFAVGAGPGRAVIIGDPRHLTEMFAAPTDSYRWGHWANALGFIVGPTSLIVSDGEDHRRRRAVVQPAFGRRRLDGWA